MSATAYRYSFGRKPAVALDAMVATSAILRTETGLVGGTDPRKDGLVAGW